MRKEKGRGGKEEKIGMRCGEKKNRGRKERKKIGEGRRIGNDSIRGKAIIRCVLCQYTKC